MRLEGFLQGMSHPGLVQTPATLDEDGREMLASFAADLLIDF